MHRFLIASFLLLLLTGCLNNYPLGFNEEEWMRLSPEQQLDARSQQAAIDEQKRIEREARADAERLRQAMEKQADKERIEQRYHHAQYGDVIQCVLKKTVLDFKPGWRDTKTAGFTLVRGESKTIEIHSDQDRKTTSLWVGLNQDAMTVKVCRNKPTRQTQSHKACTEITATTQQYHHGVRKTFNHNDMRGILHCNLLPPY